jgi:hypothetical protein
MVQVKRNKAVEFLRLKEIPAVSSEYIPLGGAGDRMIPIDSATALKSC